MTITLTPEHEKLIARAMQTGAYENLDDVLRRALETLNSEDDWLHDHKDEITEKIDRARGIRHHLDEPQAHARGSAGPA